MSRSQGGGSTLSRVVRLTLPSAQNGEKRLRFGIYSVVGFNLSQKFPICCDGRAHVRSLSLMARTEDIYYVRSDTYGCAKFKNKGHLGQKWAWILEIFPLNLKVSWMLLALKKSFDSFLYTILLEGLLIICWITFDLTGRLMAFDVIIFS